MATKAPTYQRGDLRPTHHRPVRRVRSGRRTGRTRKLVQAEIRWYLRKKAARRLRPAGALATARQRRDRRTRDAQSLPICRPANGRTTVDERRTPCAAASASRRATTGSRSASPPETAFIRNALPRVTQHASSAAAHSHPHRAELRRIACITRHQREPIRTEMQPQGQVALTFVWQATDRIAGDHSVTLQWLDEQGRPAARRRTRPARRDRPTGCPAKSNYEPSSPHAPRRGAYRLVTAVYDANLPDLPRLHTERFRPKIDRTATGNHLRQLSSRLLRDRQQPLHFARYLLDSRGMIMSQMLDRHGSVLNQTPDGDRRAVAAGQVNRSAAMLRVLALALALVTLYHRLRQPGLLLRPAALRCAGLARLHLAQRRRRARRHRDPL